MSTVTKSHYPVLDFDLGFEIDRLRETVQAFSSEEIAPRAESIDREDKFPRDLWPKMGELGLHGITVEEENGGTNMGWRRSAVALGPWVCRMPHIRTSV
jgi:isovaleryl-CoA dehydrogenase